MSKRGLQIAGLAVAGGAGYYLYSAGGSPKVAEKQFQGECDLGGNPPGKADNIQRMHLSFLRK
jgi:hypothetical protein